MTASGSFVLEYLERVVNRRDIRAVEDLVSADFRGSGHGWPTDLAALREFYEWQARTRPDWSIEVQETIEVGDCVVVRAHAGGTVSQDEQGRPMAVPAQRAVEWLAMYRVVEKRITEIQVLALRERQAL